jgi:beta-lactamase class A
VQCLAAALFMAALAAPAAPPAPPAGLESELRALAEKAGGEVGVAVTRVEGGQTVAVGGDAPLPLYSVFKLPLALTVLHEVDAGRLVLGRKVHVTPADIAPGSQANTERWRRPIDMSVGDLLALSIGQSDNTSTDKLLELVGGPRAVAARLHALGFDSIKVTMSVHEMSARHASGANVGDARTLVALLAALQEGRALETETQAVLLESMLTATTGPRRLRGNLPAGTLVADKTGSGDRTTNDVGLISLPDGSHLAMAVLISGSKLSVEKQEDVIAALARAAYDHFTQRSADK